MTAAGSANGGKTQKIVLSEPLKVTTPGLHGRVGRPDDSSARTTELQVLFGGAIEAGGERART